MISVTEIIMRAPAAVSQRVSRYEASISAESTTKNNPTKSMKTISDLF